MFERLSGETRQRLKRLTIELAGDRGPALEALARHSNGEFGVDPFGFDPDYALSAVAPFVWLYKKYFRVETHGIERVPAGRVLLVGNHAGQIPIDGAMVGVAMLLEHHPPRLVRAMTEKWAASLPYVSTLFARSGQIVGTPENCRRLLQSGEVVMVFPEGVQGHQQALAGALPAPGVRPRLHAAGAGDADAHRARWRSSARRSRRRRS